MSANKSSFRPPALGQLRPDPAAGPFEADIFADGEAGGVTAEYAIAILTAAGFAGLLLAILQSDAVRGWLLAIVQKALN
ncbi:MAG: DUF4244 domain-containing protein [Bifidobacteriaceae bacterium]|jgi:hypothetical protein|nr:DUF4244 domain-containing protein [Bifidobacteriaceae bacterium]